jgi:hypothetical protein
VDAQPGKGRSSANAAAAAATEVETAGGRNFGFRRAHATDAQGLAEDAGMAGRNDES